MGAEFFIIPDTQQIIWSVLLLQNSKSYEIRVFLASGLHFDKDWIPYTSIKETSLFGLEKSARIPEEEYVLSGFETSSSFLMIIVKTG